MAQPKSTLGTREIIFLIALALIAFMSGLFYAMTKSVSIASNMDLKDVGRRSASFDYATIRTTAGTIELQLVHDANPFPLTYFVWQVEQGLYLNAPISGENGGVMANQRKNLAMPPKVFDSQGTVSDSMLVPGDVAFANSIKSTANFIIVSNSNPAAAASYTVFARVIQGMDTVRALREGAGKIQDITLY